MRSMVMAGVGAAAAAVAFSGQSSAQGSDAVQRQYRVGQFDRISVAGPYDVQVRTSAAPSVLARGPKPLIDRLVVEVRDGQLLIYPRRDRHFRWSTTSKFARIQVT